MCSREVMMRLRDQRVLGAAVDAQVGLGLGERDGLEGGAAGEDEGHLGVVRGDRGSGGQGSGSRRVEGERDQPVGRGTGGAVPLAVARAGWRRGGALEPLPTGAGPVRLGRKG